MINKLIWDFRYCIRLLLIHYSYQIHHTFIGLKYIANKISTSNKQIANYKITSNIANYKISTSNKQIANDKISTSNKQKDLHQRTTIISSRKKTFSIYFSQPPLSMRGWLPDKKDFEVTSNLHEADIVLINHDSQINNPEWQNKKKFLVTIEPYWSLIKKPVTYINGQPLLVSNCHVNSLLTSNYVYYPFARMYKDFPDLFTIAKLNFSDIKPNWHRRNKVATMMGFSYPTKSQASSLLVLRTNVALYGHVAGITDIKGRYWPSGIVSKEKINYSKEHGHDWFREKIIWLRQGYLFNLCFENTNIPYYVTEKIWQALVGCTLPIYYSNDTIYETFPKGSFIDYRDFKNKAQLYQYILDMPADEYLDRLNLGIEFVSRYREHNAEFKRWQKTARQHIYDNLVRLHEMK